MENNNLKGIYLHGYQGFVTEEKQQFLNQLGDVYTPFIDYDNQTDILFTLYDQFKDKSLDFVSGTSLGGILVYHLAKLLNVPCLLFNPAVIALEQIKSFIPFEAFSLSYNQNALVVVGLKDEVVDPLQQINFFKDFTTFRINQIEGLEHSILLDVFQQSFKEFNTIIK